MGIEDAYYALEEKYYNFLDWLADRGVPLRGMAEWIEMRGIPSFPIFAVVALIIIGGLFWGIYSIFGPKTYVITVYDGEGNPLANTLVYVNGEALYTDGDGKITLKGVKTPVDIEVEGYLPTEWEPELGKSILLEPEKIPVAITVKDTKGNTVEDVTVTVRGKNGTKVFKENPTAFYVSKGAGEGVVQADADGCVLVEVSAANQKKLKKICLEEGKDSISETIYVDTKQSGGSSQGVKKGTITIYIRPSNVYATARLYSGGTAVSKEVIAYNGKITFDSIPYGKYRVVITPYVNGKPYSSAENELEITLNAKTVEKIVTLKLPGYDGKSEEYTGLSEEELEKLTARVVVTDANTGDPIEGAKLREAETGKYIAKSDEDGVIEAILDSEDEELNVYVSKKGYYPSEYFTITPGDEYDVELTPKEKVGGLIVRTKIVDAFGEYPISSTYEIPAYDISGQTDDTGYAYEPEVPVGKTTVIASYGAQTDEKEVEITEDENATVEFLFYAASASVSVCVYGESGGRKIPLVGYTVTAYAKKGERSIQVASEKQAGTSCPTLTVPAYLSIKFKVEYQTEEGKKTFETGYDYEFEPGSRDVEIVIPSSESVSFEGVFKDDGTRAYVLGWDSAYYARFRIVCPGKECDYSISYGDAASGDDTISVECSANGCSKTVDAAFMTRKGEGISTLTITLKKGEETVLEEQIRVGEEIDDEGCQKFLCMTWHVLDKDGNEVDPEDLNLFVNYDLQIFAYMKEPGTLSISYSQNIKHGEEDAKEIEDMRFYVLTVQDIYAEEKGTYYITVRATTEDEDVAETAIKLDFENEPLFDVVVEPQTPLLSGCSGVQIKYEFQEDGKTMECDGKTVYALINSANGDGSPIQNELTELECPGGIIYLETEGAERVEILFSVEGVQGMVKRTFDLKTPPELSGKIDKDVGEVSEGASKKVDVKYDVSVDDDIEGGSVKFYSTSGKISGDADITVRIQGIDMDFDPNGYEISDAGTVVFDSIDADSFEVEGVITQEAEYVNGEMQCPITIPINTRISGTKAKKATVSCNLENIQSLWKNKTAECYQWGDKNYVVFAQYIGPACTEEVNLYIMCGSDGSLILDGVLPKEILQKEISATTNNIYVVLQKGDIINLGDKEHFEVSGGGKTADVIVEVKDIDKRDPDQPKTFLRYMVDTDIFKNCEWVTIEFQKDGTKKTVMDKVNKENIAGFETDKCGAKEETAPPVGEECENPEILSPKDGSKIYLNPGYEHTLKAEVNNEGKYCIELPNGLTLSSGSEQCVEVTNCGENTVSWEITAQEGDYELNIVAKKGDEEIQRVKINAHVTETPPNIKNVYLDCVNDKCENYGHVGLGFQIEIGSGQIELNAEVNGTGTFCLRIPDDNEMRITAKYSVDNGTQFCYRKTEGGDENITWVLTPLESGTFVVTVYVDGTEIQKDEVFEVSCISDQCSCNTDIDAVTLDGVANYRDGAVFFAKYAGGYSPTCKVPVEIMCGNESYDRLEDGLPTKAFESGRTTEYAISGEILKEGKVTELTGSNGKKIYVSYENGNVLYGIPPECNRVITLVVNPGDNEKYVGTIPVFKIPEDTAEFNIPCVNSVSGGNVQPTNCESTTTTYYEVNADSGEVNAHFIAVNANTCENMVCDPALAAEAIGKLAGNVIHGQEKTETGTFILIAADPTNIENYKEGIIGKIIESKENTGSKYYKFTPKTYTYCMDENTYNLLVGNEGAKYGYIYKIEVNATFVTEDLNNSLADDLKYCNIIIRSKTLSVLKPEPPIYGNSKNGFYKLLKTIGGFNKYDTPVGFPAIGWYSLSGSGAGGSSKGYLATGCSLGNAVLGNTVYVWGSKDTVSTACDADKKVSTYRYAEDQKPLYWTDDPADPANWEFNYVYVYDGNIFVLQKVWNSTHPVTEGTVELIDVTDELGWDYAEIPINCSDLGYPNSIGGYCCAAKEGITTCAKDNIEYNCHIANGNIDVCCGKTTPPKYCGTCDFWYCEGGFCPRDPRFCPQ